MTQQKQATNPLEAQQNQFLSDYMDFEVCPFCARSFFRGKLSLHLKHCNSDNPMVKNNAASPKQKHKKNSLSAATNYERCEFCKSRIPSFLIAKHHENCRKSAEEKNKSVGQLENKRETKFKFLKSSEIVSDEGIFPKIKNCSLKETDRDGAMQKRSIKNANQSIRIREELRCLRKAEEVQRVVCDHCGRKFSEQAALRHIPICSMLRKKETQERISSKKSKSLLGQKLKNKISRTSDLISLRQGGQMTKQSISMIYPNFDPRDQSKKEEQVKQNDNNEEEQANKPKQY